MNNDLFLNVYYHEAVLTFHLNAGVYCVGRSDESDVKLPSDWTIVSSVHFQIKIDEDRNIYVKDGLGGSPSTNGTRINERFIGSSKWYLLAKDDELAIGRDPKNCICLRIAEKGADLDKAQKYHSSDNPTDLTIGRDPSCTVTIDGPTISRCHAIIRGRAGRYRLIDNSYNGTYVNGCKISRSVDLLINDELKIGTYIFRWDGKDLIMQTSGGHYRIDINNLSLRGRISGTSFSIEPGQLVAFVGGSGAGKSSLLTTIAGHNMDYEGFIEINGTELRQCYMSIKQDIGFVPQDDIVHADLTVEEVLRYSARLKLPDPESQRKAIEKILTDLDIGHRRKAKIRDLSGGQRKRVSIGVEMIADPRILFLDEPTSGLDPGLDKRMMELLRKLADGGRTVVLVTHATNNVMLCDQVIFLGRGGYLCYAGPPANCAPYFGVVGDFADVYQKLEVSNIEIEKMSESFAKNQSLRRTVSRAHSINMNLLSSLTIRIRDFLPQLYTLLSRDFLLQSRDFTSLVLNSMTAPMAIFLVAIAANNRQVFTVNGLNAFADSQRILFVIVCASAWLGLSSSIQTLVKEREIFKRERAFNLLPESYLASKLVVLLAMALFVALLVILSISFLFDQPDKSGEYWAIRIGIATFLSLVAISSQALLVSSFVKNCQQASSMAPLLLIPQLIFGGVLFTLSENADGIYFLVSSRWSMILMGCWSNIATLVPNGISINSIAGASDYINSVSNVNSAIAVLSIQAITMVIFSLISLLFYRRNFQ